MPAIWLTTRKDCSPGGVPMKSDIPAPHVNRRTALRRQPALGTVCKLAFPGGRSHLGLVWNMSSSGISMLLDERPAVGTVMSAELSTVDEQSALPVMLKVV